jgi:hypothetical protein
MYFYPHQKNYFLIEQLQNYEIENGCKILFLVSDFKSNILKDYIVDINNETTFFYILSILRKLHTPRLEIIIHSDGGYISTSDYISRIFLEYNNTINVYIPLAGQSAATFIALSADNIFMDYYGFLGPTDPQIDYKDETYSSSYFKKILDNDTIANDETRLIANEAIVLYNDNVNNMRELLDKNHNYLNYNQKQHIIKEFGDGVYPHHKQFTKKILIEYGFKINDINIEINNIFYNFYDMYYLL